MQCYNTHCHAPAHVEDKARVYTQSKQITGNFQKSPSIACSSPYGKELLEHGMAECQTCAQHSHTHYYKHQPGTTYLPVLNIHNAHTHTVPCRSSAHTQGQRAVYSHVLSNTSQSHSLLNTYTSSEHTQHTHTYTVHGTSSIHTQHTQCARYKLYTRTTHNTHNVHCCLFTCSEQSFT